MKNTKVLKVFMAGVLLFAAMATSVWAVEYQDTAGSWAEKPIDKWSSYGILQGDGDYFRPNDPITRGELAVVIQRLKDYDTAAENSFKDLPTDKFYTDAMLKLNKAGIIKGDNGLAKPETAITREEAVAMLGRVYAVALIDDGTYLFTDQKQISPWAADIVNDMAVSHYIKGKEGNKFEPQANISRAEVVAIINNIMPGSYTQYYLQTLEGGFPDTIEAYAKAEGWTKQEFCQVAVKAASEMTGDELAKVNRIRAKQMVPTSGVLMQKVMTTYDLNKYMTGEYKTPKGFFSICADVNTYRTIADFYYGLRLDYSGTYFKVDDQSYCVARFKAADADKCIVPKSPANGGDITDPYPFGGAGFTTGTMGRLPSPEWVMPTYAQLLQGAELYEVYPDGTEILRATYSESAGSFVPVGIKIPQIKSEQEAA